MNLKNKIEPSPPVGGFLLYIYYMLKRVQNLESVFLTGAEMKRITQQYAADLGPWLRRPFAEYYTYVCNLPYIPDPVDVETVSRPAFTLRPDYGPRDCDDKAVLLACWWHAHGVPVAFLATSCRKNKQLHHVLAVIPGMLLDATYKSHQKYIGKYDYWPKVTNAVLLCGWF